MHRRVVVPAILLCVLCATAACKDKGGVKVSSFKFNGTKAVSDSQLKSVLATVASSKIPWGTKRYFSREQFEADLKRIVAFYIDRGYPDARVTSFDAKLNDTQTSVSITVNIEEGEPLRVERIVLEGFEPLPEARRTGLDTQLPLKPGAPLDRALLQASRETALDEFRDHGYPYATVRMSEVAGSTARLRVINLQAEAGPLTNFGPIEISGNKSVSENVIRRQLTYRTGRMFRQSALQNSQRKLYSQELFDFANVEPVRGEGQPVEIPTRVTVTEGKHQKVTYGVGYGSEERARAEVDWRHVNFFGGARTMQLQGAYSALSKGGRVNLRQPYVFSPRISLFLTGQSWHRNEPAYTLNTNGGQVTVERSFPRPGPFSRRTAASSLSFVYTDEFQSYQIKEVALNNPAAIKLLISLGLDPLNGKARGLLSSAALNYHRSTADNTLNAKKGYTLDAHVEKAGGVLQGDYRFAETILEGRFYQTLADRAVVAVKVRGGSIGVPRGDNLAVPFYRRYWLGGASSLRGWGRFDVAPLSGFGLPIGGHSFATFSTEVRVPIWGNLGGVLFLDGGNVWTNPWDFNLNDMRYDVGPGLRYNTKIGPIRADFGYQLNPIPDLLVNGKPEPRRFRFHFSIGQAF